MPILSKSKPLYPGGPTREQLSDPASPWRIASWLLDDYCRLAADPRMLGEASADYGMRSNNVLYGAEFVDSRRRRARELAGLPARVSINDPYPAGVTEEGFAVHYYLHEKAEELVRRRQHAAQQEARYEDTHRCGLCGRVRPSAAQILAPRLTSLRRSTVAYCDTCRPVVDAAVIRRLGEVKVGGKTIAALADAHAADLIRQAGDL